MSALYRLFLRTQATKGRIIALLALGAVAVVVRAAGRIYRNSVLRTGARIPLREAWGRRA